MAINPGAVGPNSVPVQSAMTIEIIGEVGTPEHAGALKLSATFEAILGDDGLRNSDIRIVVGAKTYGERVQDIDLVVIGKLFPILELGDEITGNRKALLLSFFLVVEVKDHSPDGIRFSGPKVLVNYGDRMSDASQQSENQKYAVRDFIQRHELDPPYIANLLLLNNVPRTEIPGGDHNILGGDFTPNDLLVAIFVGYRTKLNKKNILLQAFAQKYGDNYLQIADLFTRRLEPTRLDMKKINLITKQDFDQKYLPLLGSQVLLFQGPGGTGKTIKLLQLAYFIYRSQGKRVLLLTYNVALVRDIRRLFALIEIMDLPDEAAISIDTVHAFMYRLLSDRFELFSRGSAGYLGSYEALKGDLLALMDADPLNATSLAEPWDYVFVDEGQDWPDNERNIIQGLYGAFNTAIADGGSQLVRTSTHCDWSRGKGGAAWKCQKVTLKKSLRQKHDIFRFVSRCLSFLEIPGWKMEPSTDVFGGRVAIAFGDLLTNRDLIDQIFIEAAAGKAQRVDLLFCVPPNLVAHEEYVNEYNDVKRRGISRVGHQFRSWGWNVWDAVDEESRHIFPTDQDQLRIVQYDSCRGMEGWSVVNYEIDALYDYKKQSYEPTAEESADLYFDRDEFAMRYARRWIAIPLSRATDVLVINLKNREHELAEIFLRAAEGIDAVTVLDHVAGS
jgi:hypothetical protein